MTGNSNRSCHFRSSFSLLMFLTFQMFPVRLRAGTTENLKGQCRGFLGLLRFLPNFTDVTVVQLLRFGWSFRSHVFSATSTLLVSLPSPNLFLVRAAGLLCDVHCGRGIESSVVTWICCSRICFWIKKSISNCSLICSKLLTFCLSGGLCCYCCLCYWLSVRCLVACSIGLICACVLSRLCSYSLWRIRSNRQWALNLWAKE